MKHTFLAGMFVSAMLSTSCHSNNEQQSVVAEWTGREIIFPDELVYQIQNDTISYELADAEYTIVTYIDSVNCVPCQMKLPLWDRVIKEFKAIPDIDVNFVMIFGGSQSKEVLDNIKQDHFLYPICIDKANTFDVENNLPKAANYRTFLLDSRHKVIAIGNPMSNPKVKAMYKHVITSDLALDSLSENSLCIYSVRNLGITHPNDTISIAFELCNNDKTVYTVQDVVPSCDCINAHMNSDTIPIGCSAVSLTYITGEQVGPFCRYVNIFISEKATPETLTIFGFNKKQK
jgi:hypothetical protein